MENNRSAFWDIMKGLGIIAVVIGHSGSFLKPFVYMYHLILFFYVAGYLYNDKYSATPYLFFGKRIKSQWILAIKYSLLFILLHNLFLKIGIYSSNELIPFNGQTLLINIINCIFLKNIEYMGGAMWFIPFLFWGVVGFCFIRWSTLSIKNNLKREIATSLIFLLLIPISLYLLKNQVLLDYHIHLVFIIFPIVQLGFLIKEYNVKISYRWYFALISTAIIGGMWYYTNDNVELSHSFIINVYVFYVVSIAGIYTNLYLASKIQLNKRLSQVFSYIGEKSFHIMALHFVSFKIVDYFCYFVLHTPYSDISAFPYSHKSYWVAYTICGIAIPSLLIYGWERFKLKYEYFIIKK